MNDSSNSRRGRPLTTLVVACALIVTLGASTEARGKDRNQGNEALAEWIDGPVRYIAVAEEKKGFAALETDGARSMFIERFWARRDPKPETLVNEYRTLFWERVSEANRTFMDSPRPGWMTDRGKIYILYGPPTSIEDRPELETGAGPVASRGLIRWVYDKPGGRRDVDPVVVVPFVPDVTGEYHVSYDPKLASVFLEFDTLKHERVQQYDDVTSAIGAMPRRSELSVMLDLGLLQEVPPAERVLLERVEAIESFEADPLDVEIGMFRHPGRDGALCSVTVRMPDAEFDAPPALLARFRPAGGGMERILGEGSFKFRPSASGGLVAQGRLMLAPGGYSLMVAAARPYRAKTALWRGSLVAAEATGALRLSDLVVAERIEPVEVSALQTWDEPFYLGPYRFVPRTGGPYDPGSAFELLYEIYGGQPPYTIAYRLEGQEDDGRWITLGRPAVSSSTASVQAWQLPTSPSWPLGNYRVGVDVTDRAGAVASAVAPFELSTADTPAVANDAGH